MYAAANGETETLRQLLKVHSKPNTKAKDGTTALMVAAASGNPEVVQLLLQAGAKATDSTRDGKTALTFASSSEGTFDALCRFCASTETNSEHVNRRFVLELLSKAVGAP
jgi:ankyrin repeat protein